MSRAQRGTGRGRSRGPTGRDAQGRQGAPPKEDLAATGRAAGRGSRTPGGAGDKARGRPAPASRWPRVLPSPAALAMLLLVLSFAAAVRFRLAGVPLERDEGEYAYAGQLILQGVPPYTLAYNMKFPGVYYAYAVSLALFGQSAWGVHVGLLLVNAGTILIVFALGRRLADELTGVVAAATFALLSLGHSILGLFGHATHFVLLPALAGFLLLLRALETRRFAAFLGAGALLGLSVLMKQHAAAYLALGVLLVLAGGARDAAPAGARSRGAGMVGTTAPPALHGVRTREDGISTALALGAFVVGAAVPLGVLSGLFLAQGVLGKFWFWTFRYAREYVTQVPVRYAAPLFWRGLQDAVGASVLLWLLAAAGLLALWSGGRRRIEKLFVTGLLAASLIAVCPGFYFRQHYFIVVLPAIALLAAVALSEAKRRLERSAGPSPALAVVALVFLAAGGHAVARQRQFLFSMDMRQASRGTYGANPFPEAVEIARYLKERTTPEDRIAVLGSEPEIYFYAGRPSATGYIYTYPLMESQRFASSMQAEMMREIEAAHPKYLVFVRIPTSWLVRPDSDRSILDWGDRYTNECFDLVGIADILSSTETRYVWNEAARAYRPSGSGSVLVFERKSDAPCTARPKS